MKASPYPAQELRRLTMAWAIKLRVNPKVIRVQEMKRKWGSCSSNKIVTLATDLVDETRPFQNYVIVHELLHLKHSKHGRLFKALLSAHVPGWRQWETKHERTR